MLQKAKIVALTTLFGVSALALAPAVQAQRGEEISRTCTDWQIEQGLCEPGLRQLVLGIINWILLFLGLVATAFLIYGGFMYITSSGNEQNVDKAKKIIMYAVVGIVIILLAFALVNTILGGLGAGQDV